jgi:hypothetical protein
VSAATAAAAADSDSGCGDSSDDSSDLVPTALVLLPSKLGGSHSSRSSTSGSSNNFVPAEDNSVGRADGGADGGADDGMAVQHSGGSASGFRSCAGSEDAEGEEAVVSAAPADGFWATWLLW